MEAASKIDALSVEINVLSDRKRAAMEELHAAMEIVYYWLPPGLGAGQMRTAQRRLGNALDEERRQKCSQLATLILRAKDAAQEELP